jgi:hypothetical protein
MIWAQVVQKLVLQLTWEVRARERKQMLSN